MSRPYRAARVGVSALIVLDLVALTTVALHRSATTPTVQQRRTADVAVGTPGTPSAAPVSPTPTPSASPPPVLGPPSVISIAITPSSTTPPTGTTPSSGSTAPSTPPPPNDGPAACPIPLPAPATTGGLQSLISLSPGFGPFSAEAFAMASAYQPVLELLGPILAQYPTLSAPFQPQINAFLVPWQHLLNNVFALIGPYYSPYRAQVLSAETKLAAFLAPYADKLANSALGGCLVDVEAALVGDVNKNEPVQAKVDTP